MLDAIKLMINGVWKILSVEIPITSSSYNFTNLDGTLYSIPPIKFTLWQYFLFIWIVVMLIKIVWAKKAGE